MILIQLTPSLDNLLAALIPLVPISAARFIVFEHVNRHHLVLEYKLQILEDRTATELKALHEFVQ